jgi:hypothetical protein
VIECFLVEPTKLFEESLRRFAWSHEGNHCPAKPGQNCHNAEVVIGQVEKESKYNGTGEDDFDHSSLLWPKVCEACGRVFHDDDQWQHNFKRLFRDLRNGNLYKLHDLPPGAMYYADWYQDNYFSPSDGKCLVVVLPNARRHHWIVDSRASNCTLPDDKEHRCWVREGVPPKVTVSKNGKTCSAGAGSILSDEYHGFLQNGFLT